MISRHYAGTGPARVWLWAALLLAGCLTTASDDAPVQDGQVVIKAMELVDSRPLALAPDTCRVELQSGEVCSVKMALVQQTYVVTALLRDLERGTDEDWSGRAICYELQSTDKRLDYMHHIWVFEGKPSPRDVSDSDGWQWPGQELHLFAPTPHERILAGYGHVPWLIDVTRATQKRHELVQLLMLKVRSTKPRAIDIREYMVPGKLLGVGSSWLRFVPAPDLLGIDLFARASGPRTITVRDITRNGDGHLVVVVSGLREGERYSLKYDGTRWRAD